MASPPYPRAARIYSVCIGVAGVSLLGATLIAHPMDGGQWFYTLVFAVLSLSLSLLAARLPSGIIVGLEATAYYAAMITLGPGAAGLVALLPILRWWVTTRTVSIWAVSRNIGMYALMTILGGWVYQSAGGALPLRQITGTNLLALGLALVTVRLLNEVILFGASGPRFGLKVALARARASQGISWAAESLGYLPAVLTAVVYSRLGLGVLLAWLAVLLAGAFALYQLARARAAVTQRVADLAAANTRLREHDRVETVLGTHLSGAADELAGYAVRLAAMLQDQYTAVAQATATAEELAQQAGYIAETAGAVDSTSEAALATAGRGQAAAAGSVAAMADLERDISEMSARMSTLEGRSRLIRRALSTINNIAGETHLLALNATIEAAGAGEQGRRFSAVAQQINSLADQALHAADEIQTTVREIEIATADTKGVIAQGLAETQQYTGQVDEARRSMEVILGAVGRASDMAQQIRQATQQQTLASHQVTAAMREVAASLDVARTEGAAVSTAAAELLRLAADLRRVNAGSAPANGHAAG